MTAAIIAFEQNASTGLLYSMLLDGFDVMGLVPYDSISVTEASPGSVSSMSFTIQDATSMVTIADAASVQMWDYARDLPVFTGWVETQSPTPGYGGAGRDIGVTCFGIEAILDQVIVPIKTAHTTDTDDGIVGSGGSGPLFVNDADILQSLAQYLPLRAFGQRAVVGAGSSQALPIASVGGNGFLATANEINLIKDVVLDGMTIRTAFETWIENATDLNNIPALASLTVDFWRGLRKFVPPASAGGFLPAGRGQATDYTNLTIVETPAGTAAATLTWTRDTSPGKVITAVYVKGGNAAATGWVVGDTTQGRAEAYIDDSSLTTNHLKQLAGQSLLGRQGTGTGRGAITLVNLTPVNAHPGGPMTITNAALGWSAKGFVITQIDKTFQKSGKQDWTVSFYDDTSVGATGQKSISKTLRSLTRTLS